VLVVSRAKQKSGRVDRSARYHHDVGRIFLQVTIALDQHLGYHATGGVRLETLDIGAREKLDIRVLERRVHTDNLRVRFAVDQAGKSVERRTPHTSAGVQGLTVFFIEQDT